MDQQLSNKITQIFVKHLNKDSNALDPTASFSENKLDELDVIEAVMRIEDDFNIEVSDDEADKLKSIQDMVKLVCTKLSK